MTQNWVSEISSGQEIIRGNAEGILNIANACKELGFHELADKLSIRADSILYAQECIWKVIDQMLHDEVVENHRAIADTFNGLLQITKGA